MTKLVFLFPISADFDEPEKVVSLEEMLEMEMMAEMEGGAGEPAVEDPEQKEEESEEDIIRELE